MLFGAGDRGEGAVAVVLQIVSDLSLLVETEHKAVMHRLRLQEAGIRKATLRNRGLSERLSSMALRGLNRASQKVPSPLAEMPSGMPGRLSMKMSWVPALLPLSQ